MQRAERAGLHLPLLAICLLCVPSMSEAQSMQGVGSPRPYRGLFADVGVASGRARSLDLTAGLFGGYDDDIFARGTGPRPADRRIGGTFAGAQSTLAYRQRMPTATMSIVGSSAFRWVTATQEFVPTFQAARIAYTRSLTPRASVGLIQRATYRPFFNVVPFAAVSTVDPSLSDDAMDDGGELLDFGGEADGPDDFTVGARQRAVLYAGDAQMNYQLTSRSGVQVRGGYSVADFLSPGFSGVSNVRLRGAGRYSYRLTQYASLRLGYGYQTFRLRDGRTNENHDIDVGINYARPFTMGRGRTRFTMTTGSALLVRDRLTVEGEAGNRTLFRMIGTATLTHAFIAPWQAQLGYVRSVAFLDGLGEPFEGDRVMASIGGLLAPRTDLVASAGYVSGSFGIRRRNFSTALGNVRVRTALTRHLALFAQYFYFQYDFAESLASQLIVAPQLERQGLRAGLTVWVPFIR